MTNLANNLNIHIGQLKSGQWVAATGTSPYFCVEAESEQAVKSLAKEAIDFYTGVLEACGGAATERNDGFVVDYSEEVTEEQARKLDDLVRKEFETGNWVTMEQDS